MKLNKTNLLTIVLASLIALTLAACSSNAEQSKEESGPDYADDEAMSIIAQGMQDRWAYLSSSDYDDSSTADLIEAVNKELDSDKGLRDRQFENAQMQEDVLKYINLLEKTIEVLRTYPVGDSDYYTKWNEVYSERTALIKRFVNEYGLTVSSDYQATLDDLLAAGTAAQKKASIDASLKQIVESAVWDVEDDGYGFYTYTTVLENTTEYNLSNVGLVVSFYDADGVKASETYTSTNSWEKGEKVRFEAYGEVDAENIKTSLDYYSVAS